MNFETLKNLIGLNKHKYPNNVRPTLKKFLDKYEKEGFTEDEANALIAFALGQLNYGLSLELQATNAKLNSVISSVKEYGNFTNLLNMSERLRNEAIVMLQEDIKENPCSVLTNILEATKAEQEFHSMPASETIEALRQYKENTSEVPFTQIKACDITGLEQFLIGKEAYTYYRLKDIMRLFGIENLEKDHTLSEARKIIVNGDTYIPAPFIIDLLIKNKLKLPAKVGE